jgi:transcriptional regulator with GAF, ATPase, and Fis domain
VAAQADFGRADRDIEVAEQLQAFSRRFLDEVSGPLDPVDIVRQAAEAIPHAAAAGLTLIRGSDQPQTLAATSDLVDQVDAIQYETGEGPCLEAIEDNDITTSNDLARDVRWPKFCARAVDETPVRSMFGVRIFLGDQDRGALNIYATEVNAFGELDVGIGAIFSTLASLALKNALEQQKAEHLTTALESSRQIGMAMGILMSSKLLTPEQAFDQLRTASQHLHKRVREVAEDVMQTGELPALPPPRRKQA